MLFMGVSTLNLQKSMFVCYLRKQSFPQENSITDIFNSVNNWPGDLTKIIYEFHLIIILEWPMFKFPWWKFWGASFHHPNTKLWSLSVVWMMPDWTILCSLFVKSRSIRVFEYSVILVSSFMSCHFHWQKTSAICLRNVSRVGRCLSHRLVLNRSFQGQSLQKSLLESQ